MVFRLAALAVVFTSIAAYAHASAAPMVVPRGTAIRHDDFIFTVVRAKRSPSFQGDRYSVVVRIDNHALRVPYQWSDSIVFVSDAAGNRYAAQSKGECELPPGASRNVRVDFDLPRGAARPVLHFWDGVLMGDLFDGVAYARVGVRLY
ncbi:MAG: hypothetical protein DLM50_00540 [Candidatus Meridianibacter frigidus]|nr:MAG: hypothetical protein DLM50_00540 [Candidatus Eremiobacteraeota bacterium]